MTRFALAALAAAALASPATAQEPRARGDTSWAWSERVAAGAWLRIHNFNGAVEVREATGAQAEVRAVTRLRGRAVPADVTFEVVRDGNNVVICAVWRERSRCDAEGLHSRRDHDWDDDDDDRRASVLFTVLVPRGVNVGANTGNGAVTVQGTGAEVSARTGNGRVRVERTSGRVSVSTGNGEVDVLDAGGPVTVRTGNGDVRVSTAAGPVNANSGNGDIDVRMSALRDAGDMEFHTGNGSVVLHVPEGLDAELVATTGNGRIESDFPLTVQGRLSPHRVRATIGRGGRRLELTSGNGSIRLLKAGG